MTKGPKRPYSKAMEVTDLFQNVNLTALANASGIPRRTLRRWAEDKRIPARDEAERGLWIERIKTARKQLEGGRAA